MASIRIDELRKEFGSIVAVDDISFNVDDGKLIVLVGPSGCGKTTLLRMIAGLETPTAGDIQFGGESVVDQPPQERDISMVFQDLALYPHLTAKENIRFAMKADVSIPESEYEGRIINIAELAKCEDFIEKSVTSLSGGQQQRVAIARALVREPEVFLLDEPLSDLDESMKRSIRASVERLQGDLDITTVHVTHDQREAMTMADELVVLNSGNIEQMGSPSEVFNRPKTLFVAQFIGSPKINELYCTVNETSGHSITLESNQVTFTVPFDDLEPLSSMKVGDKATIGIRPQHLQWSSDKPDANISIPVTIDVIEQIGTEDIIRSLTADQQEVVAVVPTGILSSGDTGYLYAQEADAHIFDGHEDSSRRLSATEPAEDLVVTED